MAKSTSRCGYELNNQAAPNDVQRRVYSDREWDSFIASGEPSFEIPFPKYDVWKCPNCQRLYVFLDSKLVQIYGLEEQVIENQYI